MNVKKIIEVTKMCRPRKFLLNWIKEDMSLEVDNESSIRRLRIYDKRLKPHKINSHIPPFVYLTYPNV